MSEEIPATIEQRFRDVANAAVEQLRALAMDKSDPRTTVGRIDSIVANVYVEGLAETFREIAREEFRRVARETVRETILGVFDRVWRTP